jgi:hypothetical protein
MSKIRWLLAALGVALVSLVPVLGAAPFERFPKGVCAVRCTWWAVPGFRPLAWMRA